MRTVAAVLVILSVATSLNSGAHADEPLPDGAASASPVGEVAPQDPRAQADASGDPAQIAAPPASGWTPSVDEAPTFAPPAGPPPATAPRPAWFSCRRDAACGQRGACFLDGDICVARLQADCEASDACRGVESRCALNAAEAQCVPGARPVASASEEEPIVPWEPAPASGTLAAGIVLSVLSAASFVIAPTCPGLVEGSADACIGVSIGSGLALAAAGIPLIVVGALDGADDSLSETAPARSQTPKGASARERATTWLEIALGPSGVSIGLRRSF